MYNARAHTESYTAKYRQPPFGVTVLSAVSTREHWRSKPGHRVKVPSGVPSARCLCPHESVSASP